MKTFFKLVPTECRSHNSYGISDLPTDIINYVLKTFCDKDTKVNCRMSKIPEFKYFIDTDEEKIYYVHYKYKRIIDYKYKLKQKRNKYYKRYFKPYDIIICDYHTVRMSTRKRTMPVYYVINKVCNRSFRCSALKMEFKRCKACSFKYSKYTHNIDKCTCYVYPTTIYKHGGTAVVNFKYFIKKYTSPDYYEDFKNMISIKPKSIINIQY